MTRSLSWVDIQEIIGHFNQVLYKVDMFIPAIDSKTGEKTVYLLTEDGVYLVNDQLESQFIAAVTQAGRTPKRLELGEWPRRLERVDPFGSNL